MKLPLRPFQRAALEALGLGSDPAFGSTRHVLCIAGTGAGKSRIYQDAAQRNAFRTLLMTPLTALARQQAHQLCALGIPTRLGAGQTESGPPPPWGAWILSPEMLKSSRRLLQLRQWVPDLLVVDECHCLWEWGDQFRQAFLLIPKLLGTLAIRKSLWLTATLPPAAREQLRALIPGPLMELGHFSLPSNLSLHIEQRPVAARPAALIREIHRTPGFGIIYGGTREACLRITHLLEAVGISVICYHGGLSIEERRNAEAIVERRGVRWVVATSAFGMGMDYPHLTTMIGWQIPLSILSLVQVVGRVGRSPQQLARAVLYWDNEDFLGAEWAVGHQPKKMQDFCDLQSFYQTQECRHQFLHRYFTTGLGNTSTTGAGLLFPPCRRCDRCTGPSSRKS